MIAIIGTLGRRALGCLEFRRSLPADLGGTRIYVSPRVDGRVLKHSLAEMDPDLLAAARLLVKPGAVVWDVGSNLGVFSVAAAHLAGPQGSVLAVEADASLVEMLRRTLARASTGPLAKVTLLHAAVSNRVGVGMLNVVSRGKAKNHLSSIDAVTAFGEVVEEQAVMTVTLDWLAGQFAPPDVVKIDIEGAELMALEAALDLLKEKRPAVYVEVQEPNKQAVTELLVASGYRLFELDPATLELAPVVRCTFNTLALPE